MTLSEIIVNKIDKKKLTEAFAKSPKKECIGSIAYAFADAVEANIIRHQNNEKRLYFFNGTYYCPISYKEFNYELDNAMRVSGVSKGTMVSYFTKIKSTINRQIVNNEFIPTKFLICFDNCVFDVKSGKSLDFSPSLHVINKLPFSHDPSATHPKWSKFLKEILPVDNCREALQMFLGMAFLDRTLTKMDKMMVLTGTDCNGKWEVLNTIKYVLGNNNVSSYEIKSLISNDNKNMRNIADIEGKMINCCRELDKNIFKKIAVENIISGNPQPARFPHNNPFTAHSIPIMIANCDDNLEISDYSDEIRSKLIFIPFNVRITEEKATPSFASELQEEASGIFNWLWEGYNKAKENNYKIEAPEESIRAINSNKAENNSVQLFFDNKGYLPKPINTNKKTIYYQSSEMYSDYVSFCQQDKIEHYSKKKFYETIKKDLGYEPTRKAKGIFYKCIKSNID